MKCTFLVLQIIRMYRVAFEVLTALLCASTVIIIWRCHMLHIVIGSTVTIQIIVAGMMGIIVVAPHPMRSSASWAEASFLLKVRMLQMHTLKS